MAFGGPRSSCVRSGTHSARRQDSRNDLTPCRIALYFVSAGAHAPHSDETLGAAATWRSSHSARRLRSLAFLCSSVDEAMALVEHYRRRQAVWNVKPFHAWYQCDGGKRSYTWIKNQLQEVSVVRHLCAWLPRKVRPPASWTCAT